MKLTDIITKLQTELSIYGDDLYLISFINALKAERSSNVIYPELIRSITLDFTTTNEIVLPKDYAFYVFPAFFDQTRPLFVTSNFDFFVNTTTVKGTIFALPNGRSVARVKGLTEEPLTFYYYSKHLFRFREWEAEIPVQAESYIFHDFRYYRVVSSGTLGTTPPTHSTGEALNGTAMLRYLDQVFDFYDPNLLPHIYTLYPADICELLMTIFIKRKRGLDYEFEQTQLINARALYAGRTNKMSSFDLTGYANRKNTI